MPLERTSDREVITISNLSFAGGEVTLVHPASLPFPLYIDLSDSDCLQHTARAISSYFAWSYSSGVTSLEDYLFLSEITNAELIELMDRIMDHVDDGEPEPEVNLAGATGLTPQEEAEVAAFAQELAGLVGPPVAHEPFAAPWLQTEGPVDDDEEGDGLVAV